MVVYHKIWSMFVKMMENIYGWLVVDLPLLKI